MPSLPRSPSWLLPLALLAGLATLVGLARSELARAPSFRVDPSVVTLVGAPGWMPTALAVDVAGEVAAGLGGPAPLLGHAGLAAWAERLPLTSPWVVAVLDVHPVHPCQAEVRLALRRPVLVAAGDVLVAADGAVLGTGAVAGEPRPLAYEGPSALDEVAECAAAAGELFPWRRTLLDWGVSVERVGMEEHGLVTFTTSQGQVLEWGRSAARSPFAVNDLPVEARVQNLRDVLERHPGLAGVSRVQLWKDRPVVVQGAGAFPAESWIDEEQAAGG